VGCDLRHRRCAQLPSAVSDTATAASSVIGGALAYLGERLAKLRLRRMKRRSVVSALVAGEQEQPAPAEPRGTRLLILQEFQTTSQNLLRYWPNVIDRRSERTPALGSLKVRGRQIEHSACSDQGGIGHHGMTFGRGVQSTTVH
jgi:hypothetical protein